MGKLRSALFGLTAAVGLLGTATALAIPVAPDIDFRAGGWNAADDQNPFTVGGITATAYGGSNQLYQDSTDGLGIRGGEHDEIDRAEWLELTFDPDFYNTSGAITGVWLTDLFASPDGDGAGESGWVRLYDIVGTLIAEFYFHQTDDVDNGEYYVDFGSAFEVFKMVFSGSGQSGSEYSVAGLTTSIPEPGTLALLGIGLLMLGFARRRRRQPINIH